MSKFQSLSVIDSNVFLFPVQPQLTKTSNFFLNFLLVNFNSDLIDPEFVISTG